LKRAVICSRRRVCITLLCILVFIPTIQIYHLILRKHRGTSCFIPRGTNRIIYGYLKLYIQFVLGIFLPYCCIALLNALIVYYLKIYKRKRVALQANTTSLEEKRQKTMTIMLFAASTYSLIIMMPLILVNVVDMNNTITSTNWNLFRYLALHFITPWNYCGNFIFYVIGGRQFRKELFNMIRCWQPRGEYKATDIQGAPIKNNPLGKIHYLSYCNRFFHEIYSCHKGRFRPHIHKILLQYLLWFKIYNHLNLKVQFSE